MQNVWTSLRMIERLISLRILSLPFMMSSKGRYWFPQLQEKTECDGDLGQLPGNAEHLLPRSQTSALPVFRLCQKLRHYCCHQVLYLF